MHLILIHLKAIEWFYYETHTNILPNYFSVKSSRTIKMKAYEEHYLFMKNNFAVYYIIHDDSKINADLISVIGCASVKSTSLCMHILFTDFIGQVFLAHAYVLFYFHAHQQ